MDIPAVFPPTKRVSLPADRDIYHYDGIAIKRDVTAVSRPPAESVIELQLYSEDQGYHYFGTPEPNARSQTLIYRLGDSQWFIKVTFIGEMSYAIGTLEPKERRSKKERQREYHDFLKLIPYHSLGLLEDTVTEVILGRAPDTLVSNQTAQAEVSTGQSSARPAISLRCELREDPSRIIFPLRGDFPSFRTVRLDDLVDSKEVANDVYRVFHRNDGMHYIFKALRYILYHPIDTSVMRSELTNLERFRGVPNIVQPAGIIVARNLYITSPNRDQPLIIRGILLQYYSGGSLKDILSEHQTAAYPWQGWGIQIAAALDCMHAAGKTHLDIKPSNIVVDAEGNAVLIDLSGIGVTYEWRAPETRDISSPEELPFENRRLYDTWGYGKLLSEIVEQAVNSPYSEAVKSIAARLMEDDPHKRMSLTEAVSRLEPRTAKGINTDFCLFAGSNTVSRTCRSDHNHRHVL